MTRESPYLLLPEAAAYARVSIATVRTWVATGALASSRPGRRRLVHRDDLDAFLQRGRREITPKRSA